MKKLERLTLDGMQEFVRTNRQVVYSAEERESAYGLVKRVLKGLNIGD